MIALDERDDLLANLLFDMGDISKTIPRLLRDLSESAMQQIVDQERAGREIACLVASAVVGTVYAWRAAQSYPGDNQAIAHKLTERFAISLSRNEDDLNNRFTLYRDKITERSQSDVPGWELGKAFLEGCGHQRSDVGALMWAFPVFLEFTERAAGVIEDASHRSPTYLRAKYQSSGCAMLFLVIASVISWGTLELAPRIAARSWSTSHTEEPHHNTEPGQSPPLHTRSQPQPTRCGRESSCGVGGGACAGSVSPIKKQHVRQARLTFSP